MNFDKQELEQNKRQAKENQSVTSSTNFFAEAPVELGESEVSCLVVIDMQNGFMDENTSYLDIKISDFIDRCGGQFDFIVATKYVNGMNTPCHLFEGWDGCMSAPETDLTPAIGAHSLDAIFEKGVYSCYNDEFKQFVKSHGINKLYMVGVNTGCCVLHSAFDSYNDLLDTSVIIDLCGSTAGTTSHLAAKQILEECITTERVIISDVF